VPAPLDIGVSTSAWPALLLGPALARAAELAPVVEIRSFGMHTLLSRKSRKAVSQSGLACTVHGPFGYDGIGSTSERARLAALDEQRRHLEAAAEVGAACYVVHPDWRPEPSPRDPAVVASLQRSFVALRELQEQTGVEVLVENMPGAGCSHLTHPGDLDLQGLGLTLDVGHASISGCLDEWLARPRAPLRHLHLHSNHGTADADDPHLPLGAGVVDAAAVMAAARAAGASAALEHDSEADVRASLAHLRRLGLIR
jgi:sugar phosphate isomerase/epimerase